MFLLLFHKIDIFYLLLLIFKIGNFYLNKLYILSQKEKKKSQNEILYHFEIILYLSNFRYNVALDIPKAFATKSLSFL